jgi:glucokinase
MHQDVPTAPMEEHPSNHGGVGGCPVTEGSRIVVGIDLGGTRSRFVACATGRVVNQTALPTEALGMGSVADRLNRLASTLMGLVPDGSGLAGVGIGASGPVDPSSGLIQNPDTLASFSGFDLIGMLRSEVGVPVFVDNDAVTAALAEHRYGAGRGADRLLAVTLGTGVGVSLLVDGRPFRDAYGPHPEAGHVPVLPGGERCYCGVTGCWETVASRGSLESRVERVLGSRDLDNAERSLAEGDDERLRVAVCDYGRALGRGLDTLNVVYGPQRIVLCGSASRFLPYFSDSAMSQLRRARGYGNEVELVQCALGDVVGAIGACVLVELGNWRP